MSHDTIIWIWIIGGITLMVLEVLAPGMIIVFFGAGALIVGLLNWMGIVTDLATSVLVWVGISLVLVLIFRRLALKFFPSDSKYKLVEEDVDAIGTVVTVIKEVDDKSHDGRISYTGTTWPATSKEGVIKEGKKARILYRDNISWVIEPYKEEDGSSD